MGNKTRNVVLILVALMVSLMLITAFAEDLITRYSYITAIAAELSITGNSASATGRIYPSGIYSTDISVMLQQQQSDGTWTTVASWSGSNGVGFSDAGGSTTIATGFTYRTYVIGHVYDADGNIIDTGTAYKY